MLAQYSWTDTSDIYEKVNVVYTDFRKIVNNETVPVDVNVHITSTEKISLLEHYKLSANGTNFIIISQGNITLSNDTYYGLGQGQTLRFTVETEGTSSLSDNVLVKSIVEIIPPAPVGGISIPVNKLSLLAPYIGLIILVAVLTVVYVKKRKRHRGRQLKWLTSWCSSYARAHLRGQVLTSGIEGKWESTKNTPRY